MSNISTRPSEHDPDEKLIWLAWQYVAEELTGPEQEAFENRLAEDQEAREAVARAVELHHAIIAAEQVPTVSLPGASSLPDASSVGSAAPPRSVRPLIWMALGAAACFAAMTFLRPVGNSSDPDQRAELSAPQATLAAAWVDARAELAATQVPSPVPPLVPAPLVSLLDGSDSPAVDGLSPAVDGSPLEFRSPDWMLSALLELNSESDEVDDNSLPDPGTNQESEGL